MDSRSEKKRIPMESKKLECDFLLPGRDAIRTFLKAA
jgi:hypothetical protein